jgi:hypothetical protein
MCGLDVLRDAQHEEHLVHPGVVTAGYNVNQLWVYRVQARRILEGQSTCT